MEERRKYSRLPFPAVTYLVFEQNKFDASLIDVSMKGALVEIPEGWPGKEKSFCTLQIVLEEGGTTITMEMEVTHFEENAMGLYCLSIDLDSMTHLRRLMELNLGDPNLIERELAQLG